MKQPVHLTITTLVILVAAFSSSSLEAKRPVSAVDVPSGSSPSSGVVFCTPMNIIRSQSTKPSAFSFLQNIAIEKAREVNTDEGAYILATLSKDQIIQGIPLAKDCEVEFYQSGKLHGGSLAKAVSVQGMPLFEGAPVRFYESGSLMETMFETPQVVQGVVVAKIAPIIFFENGKLRAALLAKDQNIQGSTKKAESVVFFNEAGKLIHTRLPPKVAGKTIQGIVIKPESISLRKNGRLAAGELAQDQTVQGIALPKDTTFGLNEKGELESIYLPSDQIVHIQGLPVRDEVYFFNGYVVSAMLAEDIILQGFPLKGKEYITLYPKGQLKDGSLSEEHSIQGILFAKNTRFRLDEDGKLLTVATPEEKSIQGIPLMKAVFYSSGKLGVGTLAKNHKIQGIMFAKGSKISFFENGDLDAGTLAENKIIQGISLPKGCQIAFYEDNLMKMIIPVKEITLFGIHVRSTDSVFLNQDGSFKTVVWGASTVYQGTSYVSGEFMVCETTDHCHKVPLCEAFPDHSECQKKADKHPVIH